MNIEDLLLSGNPLEEKITSDGPKDNDLWEKEIANRFIRVKKLDGKPIFREDAAEKTE